MGAEEETTRVNGLKRKLQRDLDEANEQIEALQRELQNQRNKARRPSTAASSEVSRMRRDLRSRPLRDTYLTSSRMSSTEELDDSGSTGTQPTEEDTNQLAG